MAGDTSTSSLTLALEFDESGEWRALPYWGNFYIELGFRIAQSASTKQRLVVGIATPTRAYCTPMLALGVVLYGLSNAVSKSNTARFDALYALPKGSQVLYRKPSGETVRGKIADSFEENGERRVRIQIAKHAWRVVNVELADSVQPVSGDQWKIPGGATGRKVTSATSFSDHIIAQVGAQSSPMDSTAHVSIVGLRSVLGDEIRRLQLSVTSGGQRHTGSLQDALMVKQLTSSDRFRSELLATDGRRTPRPANNASSGLVIFDGARSYLRHVHLWRNWNHVALLDRTEPRFDDGVVSINERMTQTRRILGGIEPPDPIPASTEIVVFQE